MKICSVYSLVIYAGFCIIQGVHWEPLAGVVLGTVFMLVNFRLMEIALRRYYMNRQLVLAVAIHMWRLMIYALGGVICYRVGMSCMVAYGLGVLGIVIGAVISAVKAGDDN